MSENYTRLDAVQQKIEDLIKKEANLKKKELKNQLTDEEEIDLEGVVKLLTVLQGQEKYWREEVSKENKPEVTSKSFGDADADWISSVTGVDCNYREWTSYAAEIDEIIKPSDGFQQAYEKVAKAFHMRGEAGRRVFLNLFLSDIVLLPEFNNSLRIFTEIDMSVESKGSKKRRLNGKTDYTVGLGMGVDMFDKAPPNESHLVALEAKTSIGLDDLWQCVAEAATLHKSRKDAKKSKCSVWGVLSNAVDWKFIYIDEDGKLWQKKKALSIDLRSYDVADVYAVYRFLYYTVKCCFKAVTPELV